ncbi:MAG: right-handed parallel beta-helix repeat-containing protein [Candidatus Binatia bacterium]
MSMQSPHRLRRLGVLAALLSAVLMLGPSRSLAVPLCPSATSLIVFAQNLSRDPEVTIALTGTLRDEAATCIGDGASSYEAMLVCRGLGLVRCGTIDGLRPGAWTHRLATRVVGSAPQRQAQVAVVIGGQSVSNVIDWTIHARAFVVRAPQEDELRATLENAAAFSDESGDQALVTFDPGAFPGADDPRTIDLSRRICAEDGRHSGLCLAGSDVIVDGLDADARTGAVILSIGNRAAPVARVYGARTVLRGLVFQGSTAGALSAQADTVAITGAGADGSRIEQCLVRGPTRGDGVSVEAAAGRDGVAITIADSEITGAAGVGVKVTTDARANVERSCLHDNKNGGAVATLGGALTAVENLVQRNAPGTAPAGLGAGATGDHGTRSTLVTGANIVRFNGARGLSVTDGADAAFRDDYVSDNQFAGTRVEAATAGDAPAASYGGVALVCNHNEGLSGTCEPSLDPAGTPCLGDRDCCGTGAGCCVDDPGCVTPVRCTTRAPQGYGAVLARCAGCDVPRVDLGTADRAGDNAFVLNANTYPNGTGTNVLQGIGGFTLAARGNQWERCGVTASCDVPAVADGDVRRADGAAVDVSAAVAARAGAPVVTGVSRGRPRAGDLVHVFGRGFNAIDGAACAKATSPVAVCSAKNPRVERQNQTRYGNLVRLTMGGEVTPVDVVAVTPTMLAFRMPVDCFAPASLTVSRRDAGDARRASTIGFCDPGGCLDRASGDPCDDASVCTVEDSCGDDGRCVPGPALDCGGACMQCDPVAGCMPRSSDSACDDGNACTTGDHCSGDGDVCVPGAPLACADQCLSGVCDPTAGCVARPASASCDDGNACTVADHCRGDGPGCVGGGPLVCAGQCLLGSCDSASGCRLKSPVARCSDGNACTSGDHCRGDADVCLAGGPASCDDGNACTIDACDVVTGCRHDPLVRWDAVQCRLVRAGGLIAGPPVVAGSLGRGMTALVVKATAKAEAARQAEARDDRKNTRRFTNAVRSGIRRLLAKVDRQRGLPPGLPASLRPILEELTTEIEALRPTAASTP